MDLTPFINPAIPAPLQGPLVEDEEGWSEVDSWCALECAVSGIVPLKDVPSAFRKAWSAALSTVLARVNLAVLGGTQEQIDRSLKWFLALPKLLLRELRRGGQQGQGTGEISSKFEALREGNWGTLLQLLRRDEEVERMRRESTGKEKKERRPSWKSSASVTWMASFLPGSTRCGAQSLQTPFTRPKNRFTLKSGQWE